MVIDMMSFSRSLQNYQEYIKASWSSEWPFAFYNESGFVRKVLFRLGKKNITVKKVFLSRFSENEFINKKLFKRNTSK